MKMSIAKLNDPAATPEGFEFWEDFLRPPAGLVTILGATVDGALQDCTSSYSEAACENNFDEAAVKLNLLAGLGLVFTRLASGTLVTSAANGGWARISGAATTDNSGGQIQAAGMHAITALKFVGFKARAQVSESTSANAATESDLHVGLFPVDTSIEASLPADGIYFVKADGGTSMKVIVRAGSANSVDKTLTLTFDKSVHTYGIAINPTAAALGYVEFTVDGATVYRTPEPVALPADTVLLTPSLAFQTGDNTGTKFVDVDYLGSYQAR